jgi:cytidine deaminase
MNQTLFKLTSLQTVVRKPPEDSGLSRSPNSSSLHPHQTIDLFSSRKRLALGSPIQFGSQVKPSPAEQTAFFEKWGIQPENVTVVYGTDKSTPKSMTPLVTADEKRDWLAQYLKTLSLAQSYQQVGNLKGDYYATACEMGNTDTSIWGQGVNIVLSTSQVLCSERASVTDAFTENISNPTLSETQPKSKVKTMILSTVNLAEELTPCSDCMSWLNTSTYFEPDTRIVNLIQDSSTKQPQLWVRTLRDILPLWGMQKPSISYRMLDSLPIKLSPSAQSMPHLTPEKVRDLVKRAKQDYMESQPTKFTQSKLSCAALFSNGVISADSRFEWHKRLVESADLNAVGKGFRPRPTWKTMLMSPLSKIGSVLKKWLTHTPPEEPTVKAIAYYGHVEEEIPDIRSLGYLAKKQHGSADVLVVCIEDDVIQVRTIRDYLPNLYISSTDSPK